MQERLENVLRFISLSYQEKQVLMTLTMMPDEGMEYELYQKLTASNAEQLDQLRQVALKRLVSTMIVTRYKQKADPENGGGKSVMLRMHPVIVAYVQEILASRNKKSFLDLVKSNWINKLVHFFDEETFQNLNIDDKEYRYLPLLAIACSAAEQKLKKYGERFGYTPEEIIVSRVNLLLCASKMSDKVGNVKDAMEYIERAIAVDGPSSENMQMLFDRLFVAGGVFLKGGKNTAAKQYYLNCLRILNDRNTILLEDVDCPEAYKVDELIQSEGDAYDYAIVFCALCDVYQRLGYYIKAMGYVEKVLSIIERVLGTENRETAWTYNRIATVYEYNNDYKKAMEYYQMALKVYVSILGEEHPDTKTTQESIDILKHSLMNQQDK